MVSTTRQTLLRRIDKGLQTGKFPASSPSPTTNQGEAPSKRKKLENILMSWLEDRDTVEHFFAANMTIVRLYTDHLKPYLQRKESLSTWVKTLGDPAILRQALDGVRLRYLEQNESVVHVKYSGETVFYRFTPPVALRSRLAHANANPEHDRHRTARLSKYAVSAAKDVTLPQPPVDVSSSPLPHEINFSYYNDSIVWAPFSISSGGADADVLRSAFTWPGSKIIRVQDFGCAPDILIGQIFGIMTSLPQHTFLVITRNADRFNSVSRFVSWEPNIWLGITASDHDNFEETQAQIDHLRLSDTRIRFIDSNLPVQQFEQLDLTDLDWIVAGCPVEHSIELQQRFEKVVHSCVERLVPFYWKGWYGRETFATKLLHQMPFTVRESQK